MGTASSRDSAARSPSGWRRVRSALVYGLFLASFPTATAVFLHARYVQAQRAAGRAEMGPIPGIDVATWRLLGYVTNPTTGGFASHPRQKASGRVRIGCFGDSFTYGQEVEAKLSYPALLEDALHRSGWTQAEVLNFGMAWHGFHQSYALWERVGRHYDLDYVLLGPGGFQPQRDMTFNHTQGASPGYLHARYVLDGDGVRLVEVAGQTYRERLDLYNRLIPPARYLLYDRQPPAVMRALVPAGSELPNPFYYRRDPERVEALETYRRLLASMARQDPDRQVVLAHGEPDVVEAGGATGQPNVVSYPIAVPRAFPYVAPQGHFSALGNALVAAQYAQTITATRAPLQVITTAEVDRPLATAVRSGIGTYAAAEVAIDEAVVGGFAEATRAAWVDRRLLGRLGGAVGIVGLEPSGSSALDACFVPVSFEVGAAMPLELRQSDVRHALGESRLLSIDGALATATLSAAAIGCSIERGVTFDLAAAHGLADGPVEMWLGRQVLLRGVVQGRLVRLSPEAMQLLAIRAGPGAFPPLQSLPAAGTVWLRVEPRTGPAFRVPLARWARSEIPSPAKPGSRPPPPRP